MGKPRWSWRLCLLLGGLPLLALFGQPGNDPAGAFNPRVETFQLPGGNWGNSVWSIVQDSTGFLWLGSRNGLYRYDGYELKAFWHNPQDPTSLSYNFISPLLIGRYGTLWVGTWGGGLNAFNPHTGAFAHFRHNPRNSESLSGDFISALAQDAEGMIWIGTEKGLNRLNPATGKIKRFFANPADPRSLSDDKINVLYTDRQGTLWIGAGYGSLNQAGLNRYDPGTESFTRYLHQPGDEQSLVANEICSILEDSYGNFWIGTVGDGLHLMGRKKGVFTRHLFDPKRPARPAKPDAGEKNAFDAVVLLFEDQDKRLWVGAPIGGLSCFDPASQSSKRFSMDPNEAGGLKSWPAFSIFQSRDGAIWLGAGGSRYPRTQKIITASNYFSHYTVGDWVDAILVDRQGKYWLGTSGSGLVRLDRAGEEQLRYLHAPADKTAISSNSIFALYEDREGFIWIGFGEYGKGVNRLDPVSGRIKRYAFYPDTFPPYKDRVLDFQEDPQGRLWIATHGNGLFFYDKASDTIARFRTLKVGPDSLPLHHINQLFLDSKGNMWIASGGGLESIGPESVPLSMNRWDPGKTTTTHFPLKLPVSESINIIISIEEDRAGNLWLMTSQSLIRFNPANGSFKQFHHRSNNFHQTSMRAMTRDDQGNLWIAGSEGFTFFDPEKEEMFTYGPDHFDQTVSCQGAAFRNNDGELLFGDATGFHAFSPQQVRNPSNTFKPRAIITELRLQDSLWQPDPGGPMPANIWELKEIELAHSENVFTLRFSGLYFRHPEATRYRFMLENHDKDWRWAGKDPAVTYTRVPPGEYLFRLRAIGSGGFYSEEEASLKIVIHPPWWATWWAYLGYVLSAVGLLFVLVRMQFRRRLAQAEADTLRQLDHAKTRLYTNISHEFRTPITVILGMARQVGERPDKWFREGLDMIARNAQRLLNLVNQMLDLSKLDAGALKVNLRQGDVIAFLRYLQEPFRWYAASKKISLNFFSKEEILWMDYDSEKMAAICSNLLSNAVKFTPPGGKIDFRAEEVSKGAQKWLVLTVADTGSGIAAEKLPYIFDRFFSMPPAPLTGINPASTGQQMDAGTGIGLALTKELVGLLKGKIEVESRVGLGTKFQVFLPLDKAAPLRMPPEKGELSEMVRGFINPAVFTPQEPEIPHAGKNLPLALIVEDNPDVITYLKACLSGMYQIETAENGEEGIEQAIGFIPDVIVSDIMMPAKDGFELCHTLKEDHRTSHIPIILLTAKADQDSRIAGLELGADAYLAKPFDKEELLVWMKKLIEGRQKLREYYLAVAGLSTGSVDSTRLDELPVVDHAFVKKVRSIIEDRLDDYHLKVQHICDEVHLSHSQLHRKLIALTGLSANRFVRHIRLRRAKELLDEPERSITSIALDTGFQHPDYFSKVFHEEYGMTPSEYRESVVRVTG